MNRKSQILVRFIVVLTIAAIFGYFVGYGLVGLSMDDVREIINTNVMPILYYFTIVVIICSSLVVYSQIFSYMKCKKEVNNYSDESEYEEYERIDKMLTNTLSISELGFIVAFIGLVANLSFISSPMLKHGLPIMTVALVMFILAIFVYLVLQSSLVKLTKRMNPKMQGEVLDFKFQKEWYSTMDESEKLLVGYASYKAFQASSTATVIALVVTMTLSAIFEFGPLPAFIIGALWIIQKVSYLTALSKKEKGIE